jgi:ferredoxin
MAKEVSRSEMLENIARSKDLARAHGGQCAEECGFYVPLLRLLLQLDAGHQSTRLSQHDCHLHIHLADRRGQMYRCEKCAKACPIHAIEMVPIVNPQTKKPKNPKVDESICLGCESAR